MPDKRPEYAEKAFEAYKAAYRYALDSLAPAHTTRLGLALNFAVFFHDVQKSPEKACHLAKVAFDEAVETLEIVKSSDIFRDSFMILQLLKDDLVLWAEEL
jgi:14-3-3 protein epsilon